MILHRLTSRLLACLMLSAVFGNGSPAAAQTDSFDLVVPEVASGSQLSRVEVTLRLTTTDPVRFHVQSPDGDVRLPSASGFFSPGDGAVSADITTGGAADDFVVVNPPDATGVTVDEVQYELILGLLTDYDSSTCASTMSGDETWTITLERPGGSSDPQIASTCPVSFRQRGGATSCTEVPPVLPDGPVASITGEGAVGCQGSRPAVDAVLVLDKSGSMSSAASMGSSESRIEALRGSVESFVTTWDSIRAVEAATTPFADPPRDDQLGMVFFTGDALRMSDVGVSAWSGRTDVLYPFTSLRSDITPSNMSGVTPGGVTSLGDGLIDAVNALGTGASADRRKVVLAMTDGLQNTSEYVAASGSTVNTHPKSDPTDTTPLVTDGDDIQIYTVTTGPSTNVGADLNEAVAQATGGFYTNAEIDASEMRIFFTEMLQNFVRFTSFETLHQAAPTLTSSGDGYSFSFPVTVTSTSLVASLSVPRDAGYFEVSLTSPGGQRYAVSPTQGTATLAVPLHDQDPEDVAGEWTVEAGYVYPRTDETVGYLSVIADDLGTRTRFHTDAGDAEPGLTFLATAQPVGPSGVVENADVQVTVGRPDAGVGDVLAQADVQLTALDTQDTFTPAEAKLYRLLQQNPDALPRSSNTVQLTDDGQNGDQTGGDGVYAAEIEVDEPGHYNVRYIVEGETEETGPFRREQIQTVHARPIPNPGPTEVQAQAGDGTLNLQIIPRTFTGGFLGPGFANYLWLTTSDGNVLRPQDELNGTYTAQIPFSGERPQVDLHFIRANTLLADEIQEPPVELTEGTQIAAGIENGKERGEPVPPGEGPPDGGGPDDGDGGICSIDRGPSGVLLIGVVLVGMALVLRRRRNRSA